VLGEQRAERFGVNLAGKTAVGLADRWTKSPYAVGLLLVLVEGEVEARFYLL
jgi:hypothetical protein